MCCDNSSVKISFWYLLVLYVNFSVKRLKFAPKCPISYFQPTLAAMFVTKATVKVKIIGDFNTLAIVLINLQEEIGEKQFSNFSKKSPLLHVALYMFWIDSRVCDNTLHFCSLSVTSVHPSTSLLGTIVKNIYGNTIHKNFSVKLWIFYYPSILTYVLGAQKNRVIETVLLSNHNICFGWEIR